jgi:fibronectin type 3 domain-containing protein
MRRVLQYSAIGLVLVAAACQDALVDGSGSIPSTPANLSYELEPSGDPNRPLGILLSWDPVTDFDLASYRIYSRGSSTGGYGLRGETTSNTFHDNGVPHLDYFVTAVDDNGNESDASNVITVDERMQLDRPSSLLSISLNGAIHLEWSDNAYTADSTRFKWYRIYSTSYDLDLGLCGANWSLEGTTVAPEFLASALTNGVPRCFGISAVSREGYESLWSPLRQDTPRPDARNVLVYAVQQNAAQAGFRFWNDANSDGRGQSSELGLVESGNATDIDFRVTRTAGDTLWIEPRFSGTSMQVYGQVADLTSIDFAPELGYSRNLFQAVPTYGYVFKIVEGTTLRYGAVRVSHVSRDYVILDWSMQTDPGNPELIVWGGMTTSLPTGSQVAGSK